VIPVNRTRVVITGIGAITPLGRTADAFWSNLVAGKSGIGPMTLCDPTNYPCRISGEVSDFDPEEYINAKEARRMARFSQLAVAAGLTAVESARLDVSREEAFRVGVVLGNRGPVPKAARLYHNR
jgi:3-oxoacyl-[acyl-carrier-protein] synthase II